LNGRPKKERFREREILRLSRVSNIEKILCDYEHLRDYGFLAIDD